MASDQKPADINALADAIARLAEATTLRQNGGLTEDQFAKTLENERKALNPSNQTHPAISAFSYPEGDRAKPKPVFSCDELYENGVRLREDSLTPLEIESYNRVCVKIPKPNDKIAAWEGTLKAWRHQNGRRVYIEFPTRAVEDLARANATTIVYRNLALVDGEQAADPNAVFEELQALKQQVAAMQAAQTVGA